MKGLLTPEERAQVTDLQDLLIERFVEHKLAIDRGEELHARMLKLEINDLLHEKEDIEAWAAVGSA
jgi:hypothetical protein